MKITNNCNLPMPIVRAVTNDDYTKGGSDYSITELCTPPQINALRHRHNSELTEDASDRIWMLLGTSIHKILEGNLGEGDEGEQRLYAHINGKIISGKYDHRVIKDGILTDYKVTSAWAVKGDEVKPEWVKQLNYYRQLARLNDIDVNKLQIVAILRDWKKTDLLRSKGNYPVRNVVTLDVPIWDDNAAIGKMEVAVMEQDDAHAGNARPCTDSERWHKPGKAALMKKGRKSAVKLFDTVEDAWDYVRREGIPCANSFENHPHHIEERPTKYNRCEDYCSVSKFCDQYKGEEA